MIYAKSFIFFPSDLDLWPINLKLAMPATALCLHEIEVSTTFQFRVNRRHVIERRTDRQLDKVQRFVRSPRRTAYLIHHNHAHLC